MTFICTPCTEGRHPECVNAGKSTDTFCDCQHRISK